MEKITLIKIFNSEKKAEDFAVERKGKVSIRYDWDMMKNEMVKEFIVKY